METGSLGGLTSASTGVGPKGGAVTLSGVDSTVVNETLNYSHVLSWISSASTISVSRSSGDSIVSSICPLSYFKVSLFWVNCSIILVNFAI